MNIHSERLGEVIFNEEEIITFVKEIPGFNSLSKYIMIPLGDSSQEVFFYLQSIEDMKVGFVVINPFMFFSDYEFDIPQHVVNELNVEEVQDVTTLTIVSSQGSLQEATTNLIAPIIINKKIRKARQVVLDNPQFKLKQLLFPQQGNHIGEGAK